MILTIQKTIALVPLLAAAALAGEPAADKRGDSLFRPTPRENLRPLSTDRPDATESPYTVDAGHAQLEADVVAYLRDRATEDGTSVRGWSFLTTNVKVGLTHRIDVQLVIPVWTRERTTGPGGSTVADGFGDIVLRGKFNLWGNDGGPTAFALLPFVKLPTGDDDLTNDEIEGGIVLPLAIELPHGFGLGTQLVVQVSRDSTDTGHDVDAGFTVALGRDVVGPLAAFVEITSLWPGEGGAEWVGTFDVGATYGLTDDVQLDLAAFVGLSRAAPDLVVFAGVSWRF